MRRGLRPDDLGDLLERPLLATLATRRADGSVLLSPVWHEWRDGAFFVVADAADGKLRHIERDPRVTILVAEPEPPYRGIEISAAAETQVLTDGGMLRRIGRRYIGDVVDTLYGEDDDRGVAVRIAPGVVRAWDFADEYRHD